MARLESIIRGILTGALISFIAQATKNDFNPYIYGGGASAASFLISMAETALFDRSNESRTNRYISGFLGAGSCALLYTFAELYR